MFSIANSITISRILLSLYLFILCTLATLSALEELMIHITSTELKANRKSIFDMEI